MLESIFSSGITIEKILLCSLVSIILGLVISLIYMKTSRFNKNFLITLAVLPILVQSIVLMTSGSLGTSIAIVGTFSLVRFRSLPGTSKEILSVFFSMTIGLAMGMGQILYAIIIIVFVGIVIIILSKSRFGENNVKILKIVLPIDLDYTSVFDDIFNKYNIDVKLDSVKTVNMGSLIELTYSISMSNNVNEKELLDDLRSRNGNLKIILSHNISIGEL